MLRPFVDGCCRRLQRGTSSSSSHHHQHTKTPSSRKHPFTMKNLFTHSQHIPNTSSAHFPTCFRSFSVLPRIPIHSHTFLRISINSYAFPHISTHSHTFPTHSHTFPRIPTHVHTFTSRACSSSCCSSEAQLHCAKRHCTLTQQPIWRKL